MSLEAEDFYEEALILGVIASGASLELQIFCGFRFF